MEFQNYFYCLLRYALICTNCGNILQAILLIKLYKLELIRILYINSNLLNLINNIACNLLLKHINFYSVVKVYCQMN